MPRYNTAMCLPTGWHYPDSDGTVIRAHTYELLLESIAEHRLRNAIPMGNPIKDVNDYACTKWPEYCGKTAAEMGFPDNVPGSSDLYHRLGFWLAGMKQKTPRGGFPLVSEEKAADRARTCMGCPRAAKWTCGCRSDVRVRSFMALFAMPRAGMSEELTDRACLSSGWGCSVACNLNTAAMGETPETLASYNLPGNCWAVTEAVASPAP